MRRAAVGAVLAAALLWAGCDDDGSEDVAAGGSAGSDGAGAGAAAAGDGAGAAGAVDGDGPGGANGGGGDPPAGEPEALAGITGAHNEVRAGEPAEPALPPLEWSPELARLAQSWADHLAAELCGLEHQSQAARTEWVQMSEWAAANGIQNVGENLATGHSGASDGPSVTMRWAAETEHYDYESGTCSGVCGHYTQVVWRDTRFLGCGVARCADGLNTLYGDLMYVCNYAPAGNFLGRKPY